MPSHPPSSLENAVQRNTLASKWGLLIAALLILIFGLRPEEARGTPNDAVRNNYLMLFEANTWTEWKPVGHSRWSRKLPLEYRNVIVEVEVHGGRVLIGRIEQCLRTDRVDMMVWYLGDSEGMRYTCSGGVTSTVTPHIWQEEVGDLPDDIEAIARSFRKMMIPRTPRTLWNL